MRTATKCVLHINPYFSVYFGITFTYPEGKELRVPTLHISALAQLKKGCLSTVNYVLDTWHDWCQLGMRL